MLPSIPLPPLGLGAFGAPLLFLLAIFSVIFLFWRSARYEYIEAEFLFDILAVCGVGALIFSRLFDFIFNFRAYEWSFTKLVFFNSFGGFDIWGGLFGTILAVYLFLRRKKTNLFDIFDLLAAPVVFGLFISSLNNLSRGIYDSLGYFALFIVIKRLDVKKRHRGFFACFALAAVSILSLIFYRPSSLTNYQLIKPAGFLVLGLSCWYILSKRNFKRDVKGIIGRFLIGGFGAQRVFSSMQEADKLAKNIILSPFYFSKSVYFFVRMFFREIYLAMLGLIQSFGVKR